MLCKFAFHGTDGLIWPLCPSGYDLYSAVLCKLAQDTSSSAAVSLVRMSSSVHSAFPFKDANAHMILSYGDCLGRFMDGNLRGKPEQKAKMCAGRCGNII